MNMLYPYIQKNLLEKPEKYQMTPYYGFTFLSSYLDSRKLFLENDVTEFQTTELLDFLSNYSSKNDFKENFITLNLFTEILKSFLNENFDLNTISLVNIFVKKFEIRKKFFTEYNSEIKEISSNYSEIKNYILFSIICEILFLHTHNLKYLNVSLKLNDLVCSQDEILDETEKSLLKFSINKELESVKFVSKKTGIDFI